jgi:hypothetical protein
MDCKTLVLLIGASFALLPAVSVAADSPKAASEANDTLGAGHQALADLKFEEAARLLRKGVEQMLTDPATADHGLINEALVAAAAAQFRLGDEKASQATLTQIARMNPQFSLPEGRYPPVFTRELEKAKKRVEKGPKGGIWIEGPPNAIALVDGRALGPVPVMDEVPAGSHAVRVDGAKGERFGQLVEVKGGSVTKVKATLGLQPGEIASPKSSFTTAPAAQPLPPEVVSGAVPSGSPVIAPASGSKAWVIGLVAVGVAAAAGGAYFGYTQVTKPVTGTVTATW